MSSQVAKFYKDGTIKCPSFVGAPQYEVIMGSQAYGTSLSESSDTDIYGFTIPPKQIVFPHLAGYVIGFDSNLQQFEQFQQHHILWNGHEYDISIYNIIKYFRLITDNNPNMIDSLFVPAQCVLHATDIAKKLRDNRHMFLHKGCWHKFRGYAFSQLNKAKNKQPEGKRLESFMKFGYDPKFLSHVVRLMDENEQLLVNGDLDLTRSRELQKAIKRGDMQIAEVEAWFFSKEKELEKIYLSDKSPLPYSPDEDKIRTFLLSLLEEYYGSIEGFVQTTDSKEHHAMSEIRKVLSKYGY